MQEFANEKVKQMGFLLLLNAPEGMQFGIDNQYWQTGPRFSGVKLIPPGSHFVYFSLKDEMHASRMGFFINIPKHQQLQEQMSDRERQEAVVVRVWDKQMQAFIRLPTEDAECSYQEGVLNMDFDTQLGVYPLQNHAQWVNQVDYVDCQVLDRIQPVNRLILSENREREMRNMEDKAQEEEESKNNESSQGQEEESKDCEEGEKGAGDFNLEETV